MLNQHLLKRRIAMAGYTQSQLAKAVGISRGNLNTKLNGHLAFTLDEVFRLCDILGIENPQEKADIFLASSSQ